MATEITVNTSKSMLSIAFDKKDYPSVEYPVDLNIPVPMLSTENLDPVLLTNAATGFKYKISTSNGSINVNAVTAISNADLITKILAAI